MNGVGGLQSFGNNPPTIAAKTPVSPSRFQNRYSRNSLTFLTLNLQSETYRQSGLEALMKAKHSISDELDIGYIYKNSDTCSEEHAPGMVELSELENIDQNRTAGRLNNFEYDHFVPPDENSVSGYLHDTFRALPKQFTDIAGSKLIGINQKLISKNKEYECILKTAIKLGFQLEEENKMLIQENEKNKNLSMAAEDASTALATSQSKIEELTSENKTLNTKITALESQLKEVNAGNTGLKKGQAKKDKIIASLKSQSTENEAAKKDLLTANEYLSKQLTTKDVRSAKDLASTQKANTQLSQEITGLKAQVALNQSQIETLTKANRELTERVQSTLGETETIRLEKIEVENELASTKEELGTLTEENNGLKQANAALKEGNTEKDKNINNLATKVKKLEDEKQILEAANAKLKSDLETETAKVNNLTQENKLLKSENAALNAENQKLTQELKNVNQKIDEVQAESDQLKENFNRQIQDLKDNNATLD